MKIKNLTLKNVPCNYCGSGKYETIFSREDLNTHLPGKFQVVCCEECGLLFLNPRPTRKSIQEEIYPEEYDQYLNETSKSKLKDLFQRYGFRKRFKYIKKFKSSGRLIDVGCATGEFLEYMQNHSDWQLSGMEPITEAANIASQRLNVEIYNKFLTESNIADNSFDVVTLWHVFEHLEDPSKALMQIHRILSKNGIVVITIPVVNSIDYRIFGKYWVGFELPRHLFFFSIATITSFLDKSGFKLLAKNCLYGSHAMTMTSLKFWLRSKNYSEKLINIIVTLLMSYPIRILLSPIFFILDKFHLSTPMTFIARKCEI